MPEDEAELRGKLARDATRDSWSERVLLCGLFLEVALLLVFSKHKEWWETASLVCANALVFVGVGGEAVFGARARASAERLQQITDEKVAITKSRAAEANERAANAERETEKLKALTAWRRLGHDMARALDVALTKIAPGSAVFIYPTGDMESRNFANDFEAVFRRNGWKTIFLASTYSGDIVYGVRVPSGFAPESDQLASSVVAAFTEAKVPFIVGAVPPAGTTAPSGPTPPLPLVAVYVGPKHILRSE